MIATIQKGFLSGKIPAISSKSYAHRLLIAAALADRPTTVRCATVSEDILTASRVLKAMGASVERTDDGFIVEPVSTQPAYCGESGTIERFILPVACALGLDASITGHGRLPERPLSPLYEELRDHGIELSPQGVFPLKTKGRLPAGDYAIAADVSSQFIGGLLFALSVVPGTSTLTLTGRIESAPYIDMTLDVLALFGARITRSEDGRRFTVEGLERLRSPGAAGMTVNAPQIPDLVPVLSVVAAFAEGETRFINAGRLRIKESDRLATTRQLLEDLGADVEKIPDGLVVRGRTALRGGACDGTRDHRIVMSAAVAGARTCTPVVIRGAQAVRKSYPDFFDDFARLGGLVFQED